MAQKDETAQVAEEVLEQTARQVLGAPIFGLGVDIVEIERMQRVLVRTPSFATRVFTAGEQAYCEGHHKPAVRYATHFAAKEAMLKALGTGFAQGIGFEDVEVTHDDKGRPVPLLHGMAAKVAADNGVVEMHLSLSRTQTTAVANAIAITAQAKPPVQVKQDPRKELAQTFKELRGILDEADDALSRGMQDSATRGQAAQNGRAGKPDATGAGADEGVGQQQLAVEPDAAPDSVPDAAPGVAPDTASGAAGEDGGGVAGSVR